VSFATCQQRSSVDQSQTTLDTIEARINSVNPNGDVRYLDFQAANALHNLKRTLIERAELFANRAQMLEHKVLSFCHGIKSLLPILASLIST